VVCKVLAIIVDPKILSVENRSDREVYIYEGRGSQWCIVRVTKMRYSHNKYHRPAVGYIVRVAEMRYSRKKYHQPIVIRKKYD